MLIELKELDVNKGNIYDPNQYPEDGMYLASDGVTTFIVTVSKQANVCLSLPVTLDLVKRYEAEKAEEKTVEKAPAKRRVTVRRPQENAKSRGMER